MSQLRTVTSNTEFSDINNLPWQTASTRGNLTTFRKNAQVGFISNLATIKSLVKEKSDKLSNYKNIIFMVFIVFTLYLIIFIHYPGWFFTDANGVSIHKQDMPYWDKVTNATYFTTTCMSTIGYGDITAKTNAAKVVVSITNMVALFISIGVISLIGDNIMKTVQIPNLGDKYKK